MHQAKLQKYFYGLLFLLLFGTLGFFAYHLWRAQTVNWGLYSKLYLFLMLGYTWYTFILLFLSDIKRRTFPRYAGEKIAVLAPCYNEDPPLFRQAIASVWKARGNKKIFIIDDGSTNGIRTHIDELCKLYPGIQAHSFPKNMGKRHALHYAVKHFVHDSDFVVTIDSDTVLDTDALIRVVEPLKEAGVGAATGDVRLRNEKQNLLTRMIATYYWIGLNVYKKAQSYLGNVVCCSGCLAAYKTPLLCEIIDEFAAQEFFGEKCTHSEDRHLTNLVLQRGHDVVFVPEAVSYTETPATIWGFLKQQQRWKRGFIRESLFTLSWAWKTRKLLFLQVALWDLTGPFFTFGLRLALVASIIANPGYFLFFLLPSWIGFMLIRYSLVAFYATEKLPGLFVYMLFYEVFLYPMNIYALFTVKNKSWITR